MAIPKLVEGVPSNLTENFDILDGLGEGTFAKVRKAKHKATGQYVAIKFIEKQQIIRDEHQLIALFTEINIMKGLKHVSTTLHLFSDFPYTISIVC
jgi:fused-like protein